MLLEEVVKVLDIKGQRVLVSSDGQSACQSCEANSHCGQKTLASYFSGDRKGSARNLWIDVPSEFGLVQKGEQLTLLLEPSAVIKGALITYVLPLFVSFFLALLTHYSVPMLGELGVAVVAILGLFGGFCLARWCIRIYALDPCLTPTLKRRVLAST